MTNILIASVVYLAIYLIDYLFYVKQGEKYKYVSYGTYFLLISGIILINILFYAEFALFYANIRTEVFAMAILTGMMLFIATIFTRNGLLVCNTTSRTERCMTPGYVMVRGADIFFQQITYYIIALALADMLGLTFSAYLSFIIIISLIHTPVVLSTNKDVKHLLGFGLAVFSVPFFYTYTSLGLIWPALYVHSLAYVFIWMALADMTGDNKTSRG